MTITIHHLQISQSERLPWLCEELSIPYELITHVRSPLLSPPSLRNLTPMGAAPVIVDTSPPYSASQPLTLAESGAAIEYVAHRHGDGGLFLPPTHADYATFLYWWHFSNANLQAGLSRLMALDMTQTSETHPYRVRLEARLQSTLAHMDEQLGRGPWLAGREFTVADVMSVFSLTTMRVFVPFALTGHGNVLAWLGRCVDRPGYRRARERADPGVEPVIGEGKPEVFGPLTKIRAG